MRTRTDNINKNRALALDQKAIQGIGKYFGQAKTVTIAGVSYTPPALKALLQDEIDATNALDGTRAQMREQVIAIRAIRTEVGAARKALKAYILGTYGSSAVEMLEDFGMSPPKAPGPKTAEAKARGVAKGTATRQAQREALAALRTKAPSPVASREQG